MTRTATADPACPPSATWGFDTAQVHAGADIIDAHSARAVPIFQTTSFGFESGEQAAASFRLEGPARFAYSRTGNPTTAVAEARIARLEGGVVGVATGSGQAASALALLNIVRSGDHVLVSDGVYGGSTTLFRDRFAEIGIETTIVSRPEDPANWAAALRPNTRALFAETISNPLCGVLDIRAVADVAHSAGVPLIVDNTLASPYLLRPIEHGADIVVHSTTKFLSGHGTAMGGIVIDSGQFDFGARPDFWPGLHRADPGHGDSGYWERFGPGAYGVRLRSTVLRDYGPAASPFNSFLLLQGLETLSLRMRQHVANARVVAAHLDAHPAVSRVHFAELPDSPDRERATRYLPRGAGSVFSVELAAGEWAARQIVDEVRLFSHLGNIGDVRSLIVHPQTTINSAASEEERAVTGVSPALVRFSIGIEDVADIIADLDQALAAVSVEATGALARSS